MPKVFVGHYCWVTVLPEAVHDSGLHDILDDGWAAEPLAEDRKSHAGYPDDLGLVARRHVADSLDDVEGLLEVLLPSGDDWLEHRTALLRPAAVCKMGFPAV